MGGGAAACKKRKNGNNTPGTENEKKCGGKAPSPERSESLSPRSRARRKRRLKTVNGKDRKKNKRGKLCRTILRVLTPAGRELTGKRRLIRCGDRTRRKKKKTVCVLVLFLKIGNLTFSLRTGPRAWLVRSFPLRSPSSPLLHVHQIKQTRSTFILCSKQRLNLIPSSFSISPASLYSWLFQRNKKVEHKQKDQPFVFTTTNAPPPSPHHCTAKAAYLYRGNSNQQQQRKDAGSGESPNRAPKNNAGKTFKRGNAHGARGFPRAVRDCTKLGHESCETHPPTH